MQNFIYALFFFTLSAGAACSQGAGSTVDECLKITPDLDRLSCYDKASGRTPKSEALSSKGSWNVSTETSKMTDQTSVFMTVQSDETINCGWNKGAKISLQLRCKENSTDLLFVTNCHMTSGSYSSYGDIEYRIDSEKSKKVDGTSSTDNRALGLWGGAKSIPVIKQMIGKQKIVARMTPYSESPFTATFDISGLEESIKPLRKECGW